MSNKNLKFCNLKSNYLDENKMVTARASTEKFPEGGNGKKTKK